MLTDCNDDDEWVMWRNFHKHPTRYVYYTTTTNYYNLPRLLQN